MSLKALSERPPTEGEVGQASEAARVFASALTPRGLPISVRKNGTVTEVELPPAVGQLMLEVLKHVALGEMITFIPWGVELTTKQAADLLNVSRPFLVKLLESGEIPFHRVGSHRRIRSNELLSYKANRDQDRKSALKRLQNLGQEFDAS